jgi:hypothetical protein
MSRTRLHPVTVLGGSFFYGSVLLAGFGISTTGFGHSLIHWLE